MGHGVGSIVLGLVQRPRFQISLSTVVSCSCGWCCIDRCLPEGSAAYVLVPVYLVSNMEVALTKHTIMYASA